MTADVRAPPSPPVKPYSPEEPAKVVIIPLTVGTLRIRSYSDINRDPVESPSTLTGEFTAAAVAGPPSPMEEP